MTADQFRTARKRLGLTQHGMAEALRMGRWGFQSIGKWEKGEVPVPGPVQVAMGYLLAAAKPLPPQPLRI